MPGWTRRLLTSFFSSPFSPFPAPPDPVNNCTVENISSSGVGVRCQAGWDGGLAQTFTLSVTHARAHTSRGHQSKKASPRVLANTSTAPRPEFALSGLEAGTEYLLTIMGVNSKGQSEPVRIAVVTLKDVAEKRTSPGKYRETGKQTDI